MMNPYDPNKEVIAPEMFFGRTQEIDRILRGLTSYSGESFSLYGGKRIGKSSMLRQIEGRLQREGFHRHSRLILPIFLNLHHESIHNRSTFFSRVIMKLTMLIEHSFGVNIDQDSLAKLCRSIEESEIPQEVFIQAFGFVTSSVSKHLGQIRVVLLIDETEMLMLDQENLDLRQNLRALLSSVPETMDRLIIVTAGSEKLRQAMTEKGSPLRNILTSIRLSNLSKDETEQLIREPTGREFKDHIVSEIIDQTGGHPHLVQFIMRNLIDLIENGTQQSLVEIEDIKNISSQYAIEKGEVFESWIKELGNLGLQIIDAMLNQQEQASIDQMRIELNADGFRLNQTLEAIMFHGLAIKSRDGQFAPSIPMFNKWFRSCYFSQARGDREHGKVANVPTLQLEINFEESSITLDKAKISFEKQNKREFRILSYLLERSMKNEQEIEFVHSIEICRVVCADQYGKWPTEAIPERAYRTLIRARSKLKGALSSALGMNVKDADLFEVKGTGHDQEYAVPYCQDRILVRKKDSEFLDSAIPVLFQCSELEDSDTHVRQLRVFCTSEEPNAEISSAVLPALEAIYFEPGISSELKMIAGLNLAYSHFQAGDRDSAAIYLEQVDAIALNPADSQLYLKLSKDLLS